MTNQREVTVSTVFQRNRTVIVGVAVYTIVAATIGLILSIFNLWSSVL